WSLNGEEIGSIVVESHGTHLIFDYRARDYDGEWEPIRDRIPLYFTTPNYGGERPWFYCPSCRGRKRVLYGGRYFRCRSCYGATYESQYEPDYMRHLYRAQHIREKLGGSMCTDDPFPEKPKRMRWKTYNRLMREERAASRASDLGALHKFGSYLDSSFFE
ncbi:MAG TPA: hypothetical protein VLA52_08680, partial [Thermohalobaculum sp.]|nr:hypothetical protein [Thermohalobaculum sp.]